MRACARRRVKPAAASASLGFEIVTLVRTPLLKIRFVSRVTNADRSTAIENIGDSFGISIIWLACSSHRDLEPRISLSA